MAPQRQPPVMVVGGGMGEGVGVCFWGLKRVFVEWSYERTVDTLGGRAPPKMKLLSVSEVVFLFPSFFFHSILYAA